MSAEQDLARALASVGGNFGKRNAKDANRAYYQKLLAAGSDTSPVQHWAQGLARITQGLTGGWMAGEERRKEEAGGAAIAEAAKSGNFESLAAALAGAGEHGTAAQVAIANAMYGRSKEKEAATEEGRRKMIEALTGGTPGAGAGAAAGGAVPLPGAQSAPGATGSPEGFNYNFGNIRAGQPWQGATGQYNGFTTFDTPENGVRAMIKNLQAYASSGQPLTISTIGAKWAPPSENNTPAWIKNVATAAGLPPDAPINPNDPAQMAALARGIATAEKGNAPPMEVIQRGIALAFGQTPQPGPGGQPGALPQQTAAAPPPVAAQAPPAATAPTPAATPGTPPAAPPALPGGLPAPPMPPGMMSATSAEAPPGAPAGTPEEMLAAALAGQPQPGALPPPSFGGAPARMAGGQLRFGPGSAPPGAPPQAAEAALAQAMLPRSATAAEPPPAQPGADVPMPSPIVRTQANAPVQPPAPPQAAPMQPPAPTAPPPQAQQQPNPYAAEARNMADRATQTRAAMREAAKFAKTDADVAMLMRYDTQAREMEQEARRLQMEAQKFDIERQDKMGAAGAKAGEKGFDQEEKLRKAYTDQIKGFGDYRGHYQRILASADQPSAAGDIAMVYSFMKMLDPTSVVREGEFATAANAGGVDDRIRTVYNKIVSGERLTTDIRKDFLDRSARIFDKAYGEYEGARKTFGGLAKSYNLDPERVTPDMTYGVGRPVFTQPPDPGAPGAPPAPPAGSGPVRVTSEAEINQLPSGAVFITPDGKRKVKP